MASKLPTTQDIVAEPQATPAGSEPTTEIPEEVLNIPAVYGLLNGAPPAVYVERTRKDPEIQTVIKNAKPLQEAGFGFYNTKNGKYAVFFNQAYVSSDELKKEDEAGTLTETVAYYDDVRQSFDSALDGTVPEGGAPLPGEPTAAAAPPVSAAGGSPPSSRVQNTLATARVRNLDPGSPTSGPVPGRGRILSNVLKSAI